MPNIASALKSEIARIARKEVKAETEALKKAAARYRSELAMLKRESAALQKEIGRLAKGNATRATAGTERGEMSTKLRFRASGFAAHRRRLGISAADVGRLMSVSGQTIYHWESGDARPRARQMPMIAAFRKLGKRQALAALEARPAK